LAPWRGNNDNGNKGLRINAYLCLEYIVGKDKR
jgi:hypothetical protein